METITVTIQKGGVAKTTTAAALAQAAAHEGKKVLCVDIDPQANLTLAIGANARGFTSYGLITGKAGEPQKILDNLDAIPAAWDLSTLTTEKGSARRLKRALETYADKYDYCIIDTPTKAGELQYNAIQAAHKIIIPLWADVYSLQAFYQTWEVVEQFKKTNAELAAAWILFTRHDGRSTLSKQMRERIEEEARRRGVDSLGAIRPGVAIQEAAALQTSLYEYAARSNPAKDYLQAWEKIR